MHRRDVRKAPLGGSRTLAADTDRYPAPRPDGAESGFVGYIIAGKDRAPAGERRLGHEGNNRHTLVRAAGTEFDDRLAVLDDDSTARAAEGRLHGGGGCRAQLGPGAVVQGERRTLVLEQEARMSGREATGAPLEVR